MFTRYSCLGLANGKDWSACENECLRNRDSGEMLTDILMIRAQKFLRICCTAILMIGALNFRRICCTPRYRGMTHLVLFRPKRVNFTPERVYLTHAYGFARFCSGKKNKGGRHDHALHPGNLQRADPRPSDRGRWCGGMPAKT